MVLPQTYLAALLLMILTLICWGSWVNTLKLAGNWRFELFYWDFMLGAVVVAGVAAMTFGSLTPDRRLQGLASTSMAPTIPSGAASLR